MSKSAPKPQSRTVAVALLSAAMAACVGRPEAPQLKPTATSAPTTERPSQEPEPGPLPTDAPAPTAKPAEADQLLGSAELPNGCKILALRPLAGRPATAEIAIELAGGSDSGRPGNAELAMELLVHGADATAGRRSLHSQIERLGGVIAEHHGRTSTTLTVRVASDLWLQALHAVADALQAPPPGRAQLEHAQRQRVASKQRAILADPLRENARALLLGQPSAAAALRALADCDPTEAAQFQANFHRPDRSVVLIRGPQTLEAAAAAARRELGAWQSATTSAEPVVGERSRPTPNGVFWVVDDARPLDAPCDVLLAMPTPPAHTPEAAALQVLSNCITQDGIGGRLERLQQEQGLARIRWQPERIDAKETTALALRTQASADQAVALFRTAATARNSLRDLGPTTSEKAYARGPAWLALRADEDDAATALRLCGERIRLGITEETLRQRLAEVDLEGPEGEQAIATLLQMPLICVVHGRKPIDEDGTIALLDLLPDSLRADPQDAGPTAPFEEAKPWLSHAVEALGGQARLDSVHGLAADCVIQTEGAPDVDEALTWRDDGALQRTRRILGAAVQTSIQAGAWSESCGGQEQKLTPAAARWRMGEAERHPLLLLLQWRRGNLKFRMLTIRKVQDREHVLLEAESPHFDRLRLELDRQSGLPRTVETWATSPEGAPVRTLDSWSDYRTIEGLRLPFLCQTTVDDGRSTKTTTYSRVQALSR